MRRIVTLESFLDAENFENDVNPWYPNADDIPAATDTEAPNDVYYIDRIIDENAVTITFELTSALDLPNSYCGRQMLRSCTWVYRSSECGYTGESYFDINDNPVSGLGNDVCGKRLSSCQARGTAQVLRYGGFPAVGRFR